MEDKPKRTGRPAKDPSRLKKGHNLSFTDAEYDELTRQATAAKLGVSEYIIEKLGLTPKSTL